MAKPMIVALVCCCLAVPPKGTANAEWYLANAMVIDWVLLWAGHK
jgi:hypothetical protein